MSKKKSEAFPAGDHHHPSADPGPPAVVIEDFTGLPPAEEVAPAPKGPAPEGAATTTPMTSMESPTAGDAGTSSPAGGDLPKDATTAEPSDASMGDVSSAAVDLDVVGEEPIIELKAQPGNHMLDYLQKLHDEAVASAGVPAAALEGPVPVSLSLPLSPPPFAPTHEAVMSDGTVVPVALEGDAVRTEDGILMSREEVERAGALRRILPR